MNAASRRPSRCPQRVRLDMRAQDGPACRAGPSTHAHEALAALRRFGAAVCVAAVLGGLLYGIARFEKSERSARQQLVESWR